MVRMKYRYLLLNILYPKNVTRSTTALSTPAYLEYQAPTPSYVSQQVLLNHVRSQIGLLFGDHGVGVSLASLKLIYFSNATSTAILRVPRNYFRLAWAALTYIDELPAVKGSRGSGPQCVIRVVRVSGTIRKAEEELLRRSRQEVVRARSSQTNVQTTVLDRLNAGTTHQFAPLPNDDADGIEDRDDNNDTNSMSSGDV